MLAARTHRHHALCLALAIALAAPACGGDEFAIPETPEERLALLDAKQSEIRKLRAQVAELERAIGADSTGGGGGADSRLVAAAPVTLGTFAREIELQATVESDETGVVTTELPGRVTRVLVEEGQYVRRGQALVRVNLESVGLQIAELQTQLDLARDLAARQERLRAQNIGTEVQLLEARNAVERLEKAIEQLRVQEAKAVVTAPISGTIENKMINAGELATPGVPLMQIVDAATVKVVADVPEVYLRSVRKGQKVRVTFPALADAREARVTDIGRTIDPANRTFRVELELPNPGGRLKPNLLANVYLVDYRRDNVVTLPSEVILEDVEGREYVFVAEPKGAGGAYVAEKRLVTTGENDALRREVLSGLQPGELVVTRGMRRLSEGQTVRIDGLAAPGAAPAAAPATPATTPAPATGAAPSSGPDSGPTEG